jgi:hypothetical protein
MGINTNVILAVVTCIPNKEMVPFEGKVPVQGHNPPVKEVVGFEDG